MIRFLSSGMKSLTQWSHGSPVSIVTITTVLVSVMFVYLDVLKPTAWLAVALARTEVSLMCCWAKVLTTLTSQAPLLSLIEWVLLHRASRRRRTNEVDWLLHSRNLCSRYGPPDYVIQVRVSLMCDCILSARYVGHVELRPMLFFQWGTCATLTCSHTSLVPTNIRTISWSSRTHMTMVGKEWSRSPKCTDQAECRRAWSVGEMLVT